MKHVSFHMLRFFFCRIRHRMSMVMRMKTREKSDSIFLPLCVGLLLWFLSDAGHVRQAAAEALKLCAASVIPALFPFLVVTGTLISLGFGDWAAPLLSPLMTPLFRLPGQAGGALVLGFFGGYPIGAKTAAELYKTGALTRDEAERLLGFCNNANPAFLISVLGSGVFGSVRAGIWLLLIHVLSALLTGLLFRNSPGASREKGVSQSKGEAFQGDRNGFSSLVIGKKRGVFSAFVESVGNAAMTILRVCAFVVFFYILAFPLRAMGGRRAMLSVGLLELFSLTPLLTRDTFGFVTAAACSAFGGLGVLCQTAAALEDSGLSPGNCALGKIIQGVLAGLIAAGLLCLKMIRF